MYNPTISVSDMIKIIEWWFKVYGANYMKGRNIFFTDEDIEDIKQQILLEMNRVSDKTLKKVKLSTLVTNKCKWIILRFHKKKRLDRTRLQKYRQEYYGSDDKIASFDERAFDKLKPLHANIIKYRFGFTTGENENNVTTGDKFGLSRERIRQILDRYLPEIDTDYIYVEN